MSLRRLAAVIESGGWQGLPGSDLPPTRIRNVKFESNDPLSPLLPFKVFLYTN